MLLTAMLVVVRPGLPSRQIPSFLLPFFHFVIANERMPNNSQDNTKGTRGKQHIGASLAYGNQARARFAKFLALGTAPCSWPSSFPYTVFPPPIAYPRTTFTSPFLFCLYPQRHLIQLPTLAKRNASDTTATSETLDKESFTSTAFALLHFFPQSTHRSETTRPRWLTQLSRQISSVLPTPILTPFLPPIPSQSPLNSSHASQKNRLRRRRKQR